MGGESGKGGWEENKGKVGGRKIRERWVGRE